jgi:hypothetical protein
MAFDVQAPILFHPEFFIGHDLKVNCPDWLGLGIGELEAEKNR